MTVSACQDEGPTTWPAWWSTGGGVALQQVQSCEDLQARVRQHLIDNMRRQLQQNLDYEVEYLDENNYYCGGWGWGSEEGDYSAADASAGNSPNAPPSDNRESAGEYTTTNNQVAGVDEADLVKNDGSRIYLLTKSELLVLKAWPAAETHVLGRVALPGLPLKLFVENGRAVVYTRVAGCGVPAGESAARDSAYPGYGYQQETTRISVFDLADETAPVLEREIDVSGSLMAARRIGEAVHTAIAFPNPITNYWVNTWPNFDRCEASASDVVRAYVRLEEENRQLIAELDLSGIVPSGVSTDFVQGVAHASHDIFAGCEGFFDPTQVDVFGYVSVLSFPLMHDHQSGAATVLGSRGTVYASEDNLYVAAAGYLGGTNWYEQITAIHKFGLDERGVRPTYRASGHVPGYLINQFALDEFEGSLRVATTRWEHSQSSNDPWSGGSRETNGIFILQEQTPAPAEELVGQDAPHAASVLALVGAVPDFGATEDIRSVRFDGPRGFVVTFKKTDPLFTFDLASPTSPQVLGELIIPGFSTYMHFLDENHLLTIGFDASDQGSFAWFTGIQLQIFDVSDMENPRLAHKEVIGTRGTTSDATDDHLAFTFFRSKGLLALPMGICEGGNGDGGYGSQITFNGLLVYHVDVEDGFNLVGQVDHRDAGDSTPSSPYGYDNGCYNWWQSPNSQVKRSIFMDDFVYSISGEALKVNALDGFETLASIPLEGLAQDQCGGWWF